MPRISRQTIRVANGLVGLHALVCARHGHDLMGCKSPVHYPEGYSI